MRTIVERAKLPPGLEMIDAKILMSLLPDLSVTVDPRGDRTSASKATFTVTLSPGILASKGYVYPDIRIEDLSLQDEERVVWEVRGLRMDQMGDQQTMMAEWDMPADAVFNPDFDNELRITVDSANAIAERQEGNNSMVFWGTTLG